MKLFTVVILAMLMMASFSFSQIVIDGDMLDWQGIPPLDQPPADEQIGDNTKYGPSFDLMDLYITNDSNYVYVRIDIDPAGTFSSMFDTTQFDNPPVLEFYMDTEIGDTTGFDWGWWNQAMNYYIDLATYLNPDSTEKKAILYKYNGSRIPTWAPGEFEFVDYLPMAVNDDDNKLEFAIPIDEVNFGTEFRPWVYCVANWDWNEGADQLPNQWDAYMLKYDFYYGGMVYQHVGTPINNHITIDGDMLDWTTDMQADTGMIAEELGDMPTGPEFDVQDVYATSDSNYFYMRFDINPAATFSGMYSNYPNPPAVQVFFDVNWGRYTGLGYDGFWLVPPDYMIDFSEVLSPDTSASYAPLYLYVGDYSGAYEEWLQIDSVAFAVNEDNNKLEFAVAKSQINVDTDVRPWIYVVGNENWDNEEYWPNSVVEGYMEPPYYLFNYNFITGGKAWAFVPLKPMTGVHVQPIPLGNPKTFQIVRNYPNPFNPNTTIEFNIAKAVPVTVKIYDVLGREVKTLLDHQTLNPGLVRLTWNGTNASGNPVGSGVYFYRIVAGNKVTTRKMMLMK